MYRGLDVPDSVKRGNNKSTNKYLSLPEDQQEQEELIPAGKALIWQMRMWAPKKRPRKRDSDFEEDLSLKDLWSLINSENWQDSEFSLKKALICTWFSRLAYLHVPDFELRDSDRVKVVPCRAYQEIIASKTTQDVKGFLRSGDFGNTFIVESRFAVVIGVMIQNVTFIAIRGTKYLYDWKINLNARHSKYTFGGIEVPLHRGFFTAVTSLMVELQEKLLDCSKSKTPIYITGHSLGGAMAAILHGMLGRPFTACPNCLIASDHITTNCCYTFGMPRYGDTASIALRNPFHLLNKEDIVPSVPPQCLGYVDSPFEMGMDGKAIRKISRRDTVRFFSWIFSLLIGSGIAHHNIELYLKRIREHSLG